jgi:hypothetical protein
VTVSIGDSVRRISAAGSLCLILAVLFNACAQDSATTELTRPTTAPAKVVSFSGLLQPQGTDSYTFTVTQAGYVEATLVGLGAPSTTTVGFGIGTPSATSTCSVLHSVTTGAGTSAQIVGTGLAGTLCITIFDLGNLTGPTLYTITVATS